MRELLIATNNPGKLREFRDLLAGLPLTLVAPADIGLTLEVEETGKTFEENARLKALSYAQAGGRLALADDSGIEVDALWGAPGVLSARYGGPGLSDEDRVQRLLDALEGIPDENRGARFRCVIAVADPERVWFTTEGIFEGRIGHAPRGSNGFGYDPIFELPDLGCTSAELDPAEKNQRSHRGAAVRAARDQLARRLVPEELTHFGETGRARMVDITEKAETGREAVARGRIVMAPETLARIREGGIAKGDVLAVAQVGGIMAAKETPRIIPMCHPLLLGGVDLDFRLDLEASAVEITATVRTTGRTGAEMEALTAVSVAALTIYDMCKAIDKRMRIDDVRLVRKSGGKSGLIDFSDDAEN